MLVEFDQRGYRVEGSVNREGIIKAMLSVGRNIGAWSPSELEQVVAEGAVLWPLERYLAYYDRLPLESRREMSRQWGQPPGDVMTVIRDGQQYLVLPVLERGNLLLAAQPARAIANQHQALYHDAATWPTHQYLAFYLWLRYEWEADAVVHLGRHGTLEFLPGKSAGVAWHDASALVLGDLPNIYPYIVDGIGEAVAAKRRGHAVLLTHATPPLPRSGLYGELAQLQQLINQYAEARDQQQRGLQRAYADSIFLLAESLGYGGMDAGHSGQTEGGAQDAADKDHEALIHRIEHWLEEVATQTSPRGLHTLGQGYSVADTADMLPRMFRDELQTLRDAGEELAEQQHWLAAAAAADSSVPPPLPEGAAWFQPEALETEPSDRRERIEATAWAMRHNQELDALQRTLDGRFLTAGPPGDPLSNPAIFPTGRNQYQYNPARLPTREAWTVGQRMAEQMRELHRRRYGEEPTKLGVTLWANTLIRSHGALESQVLYLLGLEPVWNQRGELTNVRLVTPLGRPRIDVVMTITGMYRDSFPEKVLLLDRAVQLAHDAPCEPDQTNHVREHTDRLASHLVGSGASPEDSRKLALLRIFGPQTGQYGAGIGHTVRGSEAWSDRSQVAEHYLGRMSYAFSQDQWSQPVPEVFRQQLRGVQAVIHGRSSNLYGIMDLTENFEFQGGLALAVEQLDGQQPDLYVNDLVQNERVMTAREAVVFELLSRYHHPDFIGAMKAEGYDGARYFSRIADNQFGWNVVSDVITTEDWKELAAIYLEDRYELGLADFFHQHNPHALQNMASRILETHRLGLQTLDTATLESAARVYVETVAKHGAACASHICANPELAELAEHLVVGAAHSLPDGLVPQYRRQLRRTGNEQLVRALGSGASHEIATQPQAVEGHVLSEPPPQRAEEPVETTTSPLDEWDALPPNTASRPDLPASDLASTQTAERNPSRSWVAFFAMVLAASAFALGMIRRAVRNRQLSTTSN